MRLDQKREWSNRKLEEKQLMGNQAWQDSRKAVHQRLKQQMFLNSDEKFESCQLNQLPLIHMIGSTRTKLQMIHLYQVNSRNFMQYMNQK